MPHHSTRVWARASIVAFVLFAISLMLMMDFLFADLRTVPFLRDGFPIADSELHINHLRLIAGTVMVAVTGGAAFVAFLVWQYLATANARVLAPGVRFRPAAAVVSWFLPGPNLVLPPLAVGEVWRASDPEAGGSEWRRRRVSPLIWVWWLVWLAATALTVMALRGTVGHLATPAELIDRDHEAFTAGAVGMILAGLSIAVLLDVNRRQSLKEDRLLYPEWTGWSGRERTPSS